MTIFYIALMFFASLLYFINPELSRIANSVMLVTLSIKALSLGVVALFLRRNE